jgi:hypothetical protein
MRSLLVATCLIFTACVPAVHTPWPEYAGDRAAPPTPVSDDDLYAASAQVLTDNGYVLAVHDRLAGLVITQPVTQVANEEYVKTYAWRVLIADGTLRIEIDCAFNYTWGSEGCSNRRDPAWIDQVSLLRNQIFGRAQERAAGRESAEPGVAVTQDPDGN